MKRYNEQEITGTVRTCLEREDCMKPYTNKRRIAALLLCAVMIGSSLLMAGSVVFAYDNWASTVTSDDVNVRKGPGTKYGKVTTQSGGKILLDTGQPITVIGEDKASDGATWYQIRFTYTDGNTYEGYMHGNYVAVEVDDPEFDAYLEKQGFPESYREALRQLHAQYPNWVFTAFHTGLDWETVIQEESKLGKSLVLNSQPSSWKSTQSGAYNWDTGEWITFDSGGWVQASEEIIRYYMDPRNFLGASSVFQFMLQSFNPDIQTMDGLERILEGSFMAQSFQDTDGKTYQYKDVIMEAAEKSGVNPYVLAATMQQEQGDGTNNNISGTCPGFEGYFNYFNIGAYRTDTMTAAQRGLWFASGQGVGATSYMRPWNTRRAAIIGGSIWYGEKYVSVGQDTLYLKKYNVQGDNPFNHQYMTNVGAANSEGIKLAKAYDQKARQAALEFSIPVYENMPETPCKQPTGDGSPNYLLSSLGVEGFVLTPSFDKYETEYSLIVPYETSSVRVNAQTLDSSASVKGSGYVNLAVGVNDVNVVVTAGNGTTKTYHIAIARQQAQTPDPDPTEPGTTEPQPTEPDTTEPGESETSAKEPEIQTSLKLDGGLVSGVPKVPISVSEFLSRITVSNGTAQLLDSSGKEKSGNAATGDTLVIYKTDGSVYARYGVVLYGDGNGDGKISILDLIKLQNHILKVSSLSGQPFTALDVNRDGRISILDLIKLQNHILKISDIVQ